jgi:two-component system, OmpR family, sensor kinase
VIKLQSLALRLVVYLLFSQTLAFLAAWALVYALILGGVAFEFDFAVNDFAFARARDLVVGALAHRPDGSVAIEPTPELRALAERTPTLKFAVFDPNDGNALTGSSQELVALFSGMGRLKTRYVDFGVDGDATPGMRGAKEKRATPFGLKYIVAYGYVLHWDDLLYFVRTELRRPATFFAAMSVTSAIVSWFAIRHGLKPLRVAAAQAAAIEIDSLSRGIDAKDIPTEIQPLVDAVNSSFYRLEAGVARMRRFVANAAHELRTPLAIMRARLENAKDATYENDLKRDVSHIQAIVEQMLVASRLTEQQAPLDQEVDLVETIWQIVADYMPLVVDGGQKIEFDCGDSPVMVRGNRRAIECVVANVIDNALRAEPFGGTVRVRVTDTAIVEIIDHGEGIALEDREAIFDPFWRGSESTPGTGLGLAIAKELMDKLQGRIWVEETVNGGATFKIQLAGCGTNS